MRLKNYKFTKTLRELLDSSGVAEIEFSYRLRCPYTLSHVTPITYETKVYPLLIGGTHIIAELTCPVCGKTHYRLIRFMSTPIKYLRTRLLYLSSDIIHRVYKRELEAFMGTSIDTILEDYHNVWTKYRAKFQDNYSLYCSYKTKLPREKVYTYLFQLPISEMSSTARQVLQMNSAYYPIEALWVALDMIEEQ